VFQNLVQCYQLKTSGQLCRAILCLSLTLPTSLLVARSTPQIAREADEWKVLLPEASQQPFRWIEASNDLEEWTPISRDYGFNWGPLFPDVVEVNVQDSGSAAIPLESSPFTFYRLGSFEKANEALSEEEAVARFLQQTTFGPTRELIASFPGVGEDNFNTYPYPHFEAWIDAQAALPPTSLRAYWRERSNPAFTDPPAGSPFPDSPFEVGHNPAYGQQFTYYIGQTRYRPDSQDAIDAGRPTNDIVFNATDTKRQVWYSVVMEGEDVLRQRLAWAMSQIFVIGEAGSNNLSQAERWLSYYDIFVRNAFSNFRQILGEVTFHPHMGYYLSYTNNRKADPSRGTFPDENYAREVMQLFTIGLWELNLDGTFVLDDAGQPIPTYSIEDVEEFARIFTGLRRQPNRTNIEIAGGNFIDPMRMQAFWHDFGPKTLLDGSVLQPAGSSAQDAIDEIDAFLDHLFNHPCTAPFIARRLIQRLTVSNPSPQYILAVATAFEEGSYLGSGSGQRGDLMAVWKAILLHPEAREASLSLDDAHGKLREPLVRFLHYARSFNLTSVQTHGLYPFTDLDDVLLQSPFKSPSVFNFYLPDFQPNGDILERGIYAPEFELFNDVTALAMPNGIRTLVYEGIRDEIGHRGYSQGNLDLSYEMSLAQDDAQLLDHLDLMLTAGRLHPDSRRVLLDILSQMPASTESQREARVQRLLSLFSLLPEFNVLY
jgi:uncharacterized protein (DUF1800 family)